jgi:hypothetical protein
MKALSLIAAATLCFAASEPICSINSLRAVEASINDRVQSNVPDPYYFYAPARGTYLEGYGAVFTVDMGLVPVSPMNYVSNPFKPAGAAEKDLVALHDRKLKKVDPLKTMMRDLMVSACQKLPGLPANERIVMEAFLVNFKWEQSRDLPNRIVLKAHKQALLDAAGKHLSGSDLAALFEEEIL